METKKGKQKKYDASMDFYFSGDYAPVFKLFGDEIIAINQAIAEKEILEKRLSKVRSEISERKRVIDENKDSIHGRTYVIRNFMEEVSIYDFNITFAAILKNCEKTKNWSTIVCTYLLDGDDNVIEVNEENCVKIFDEFETKYRNFRTGLFGLKVTTETQSINILYQSTSVYLHLRYYNIGDPEKLLSLLSFGKKCGHNFVSSSYYNSNAFTTHTQILYIKRDLEEDLSFIKKSKSEQKRIFAELDLIDKSLVEAYFEHYKQNK